MAFRFRHVASFRSFSEAYFGPGMSRHVHPCHVMLRHAKSRQKCHVSAQRLAMSYNV